MGLGSVFPINPDLAYILGDTDFDFDNMHFWTSLVLRFTDFWIPRISRFLDLQISGFPDFIYSYLAGVVCL